VAETIWKYELKVQDTQEIDIPCGYEVLMVNTQKGIPCLWVRVDPNSPKLREIIYTHGTGHNIEHQCKLEHLGSYLTDNDEMCSHVFKISE